MIPKPDSRLRAVLDEISCGTLADIGCDHGIVGVTALLQDRASKVIAVDISPHSIHKCRTLGNIAKVEHRLDCRIGDGFAPIKAGEADCAVIAGLGGREIARIISAVDYKGRLVLVPHQDAAELRKFLSGRYSIDKDYTVACGSKYYSIIVASCGSYTYTQHELYFGRNLPLTTDCLRWLEAERAKLAKIVSSNNLTQGEAVQRLKEAQQICLQYGI